MPIYEYKCQNCGHFFEVLQRISEEPLSDCPKCKKDALKKLVSAPNFRLKGEGWYETDFKKDRRKNLAENKEEKTSDKDKKSDEKTSEKDADKKKKSEDKTSKDIT
ncbi:MAG TPA: zinc ribbon domain-containing protein [Gammaproteobacteria bacterium]|mgnify:FL=1|jgi:putative FmdB family regulatory protein|nr:zinc ribbon domain-containing protein [Gammaproteobacteria bacterium]